MKTRNKIKVENNSTDYIDNILIVYNDEYIGSIKCVGDGTGYKIVINKKSFTLRFSEWKEAKKWVIANQDKVIALFDKQTITLSVNHMSK